MKLLVVALILTFIGGIAGLSCYTCTYGAAGAETNTDACLDPFDGSTTDPHVIKIDCDSLTDIAAGISPAVTFDTCAKTTGTINGVYTVGRTCFASAECPSKNGCYSEAGATVCCCNSDFCNGAGSVTVSLVTTAAVVLTALFLSK